MTSDSLVALAEELFLRVVDLSAQQRDRVLSLECRGNPALRTRVEQMLSWDAEGYRFDLPSTSGELPVFASYEAQDVPERIGPYQVVGLAGSGGMGMVYEARRDDGSFDRRVAIKVLRPWLQSTEEVQQRFQAERRLLAQLEHPFVARLVDAGSLPDGRPYLVMEYIEGRPFDVFCDDGRLSVDERLRLFARVCRAVEYAHQNLVVHRDIKPANILVQDCGTPRLLDFGIAKVISGDYSAKYQTDAGIRPMSRHYASPEQVLGSKITTACDVYSLGVVLYRTLVGACPYDLSRQCAPYDLEQAIVERTPLSPSRRARGGGRGDSSDAVDGESCAQLARLRSTTPEGLSNTLRGDLDAIVSTALSKAPAKRYASVGELRADVERYLSRRPVSVRTPSLFYLGGRFWARHRTGTLVTLVGAMLALLALVLALRVHTHSGRVEASERLHNELQAIGSAIDAVQLQYVKGVPAKGTEEHLGILADRIEQEFRGYTDLQAALNSQLGKNYYSVGLLQEAREQIVLYRQRVPAGRPDSELLIGDALKWEAVVLRDLGNLRYSEELARQSIATLSRAGATSLEHEATKDLVSILILRDEHESALRLIDRFVEGVDPESVAKPLMLVLDYYRAIALVEQGRAEPARRVAYSVLGRLEALQPPIRVAAPLVRSVLAEALFQLGEEQLATEMTRHSIEAVELLLAGERDRRLATMRRRLASMLRRSGQVDESQVLQVLDAALADVPQSSATAADVLYELSLVHFDGGRYEEASRCLTRAHRIWSEFLDEDSARWRAAAELKARLGRASAME